MADGSIIFDTKLDNTGLEGQLNSLESTIKKVFAGVGIAAVTKGLVDLTGEVINAGMSFESSFADVIKTVDATDTQIAQLRDGFRDMALSVPLVVEEINGIGAAAGQLGIATDNIEGFTKTMADLGVATNMTSEQAATSFARFANITGMAQTDFDRLGSAVVDLGNNFATTESEISDMSLRLAAAGTQAGMSEADILGIATAMSSLGMESQAGGSAMSRVISNIQLAVETGSDKLGEFASVAGMTAEQFATAFQDDAAGALTAFVTGLGNMEAHGKSAIELLADMEIKERNMTDALLRASGGQEVFTDAINTANEAWAQNTALTNEAEQRYATLESKVQLLKNGFNDIAITVYDTFSESLKSAADTGIDAMGRIGESMRSGELQPIVQKLGESIGNLFEKIAAGLEKNLPKIISIITAIVDNADMIITVFTAIAALKFANSVVDGLGKITSAVSKSLSAAEVFGTAMARVNNTLAKADTAGAGYAKMVDAATKKNNELSGSMSALDGVIGVLSGKVDIASAAHGVFGGVLSALSNPVVGFTAALGVLAGAVYLVVSDMNKLTEETQKVVDAADGYAESAGKMIESSEEWRDKQREQISETEASGDALMELATHIDELAGKSVKTAEDNDELVRSLMELNALDPSLDFGYDAATGEIYKMVDGNRELVSSIEAVVAAKQAELNAQAYSEAYVAAKQKEIEVNAKIREGEKELADARQKTADKQAEYSAKQAEYDALMAKGANMTVGANQTLGWEVDQLRKDYLALEGAEQQYVDALTDLNGELETAKNETSYYSDEMAKSATAAEEAAKANSIFKNVNKDTAAGLLELAEAAQDGSKTGNEMAQAYKELSEAAGVEINADNIQEFTNGIKQMGPASDEAKARYEELKEIIGNSAIDSEEAAAAFAELSEMLGQPIDASNYQKVIDGLEGVTEAAYNIPDAEMAQRLQSIIDSMDGLEEGSTVAQTAMQRLADALGVPVEELNLDALKGQLDSLPPEFFSKGTEAGQQLGEGANSSIINIDIGGSTVAMVNKGIGPGQDAARSGGQQIGAAMDEGAASGAQGGAMQGGLVSAVSNAVSAATGQASSGGQQVGSQLDAGAATGVGSGGIVTATKNAVTSAISAGKGQTGGANAIGTQIGAGVESGIRSKINAVASAAVNLVSNAMSKAKAAAGIASPSKVMYYYGEMISTGLAEGITNYATLATKAASDMVIGTMIATRDGIIGQIQELNNEIAKEGNKLAAAAATMQEELDNIAAARAKEQEAARKKSNAEAITEAHKTYSDLAWTEKNYHAAQVKQAKAALDKGKANKKTEKKDLEKLQKAYDDAVKAQKKNDEEIAKSYEKLQDAKEAKRKSDVEAERKAREEILKEQQKQVQELQKSLETIQSNYEKAIEEWVSSYEKGMEDIQDKRDSFSKKLQDSGSLFEVETRGRREVYSLTDLNAQAQEIARYGETMAEIIRKGVPDELLAEVGSMAMQDAQQYMEALNKLSDQEYNDYIRAWEQRQKAADDVAAMYYSKQERELQAEYNAKLQSIDSQLAADLAGFNAEVEQAAQAAGYKSGQAYIQAIAAGAGSLKGMLSNTFESIIMDSFNGIWSGGAASSILASKMTAAAATATNTVTQNNTTTEYIGSIGFNANGNALARALAPYLELEANRTGGSLVK